MAMQPYDNSALPQEKSWRLPSNFQTNKSGGVISIDTVEQLRNEGVSNKVIADYMSSNNPGFRKNYEKVRLAYGDNENAAKSYINYRFYGDVNYEKQSPEKENKGILSYPSRVLDNVFDGWKRSAMEMGRTEQRAESGEMGPLNQFAHQFGDSALAVAKPLFAPITEAMDTKIGNLLPSVNEAIVNPVVSNVVEPALRSDVAQQLLIPAAQKYSEYSSQNPTLESVNKLAVGGGALALGIAGIDPMKSAGEKLMSAATNPVQTVTQTIPKAGGKFLGNVLSIPKNTYAGIKNGLGYGKIAVTNIDDQLGGKAAEFVAKGGDQRFVNDLVSMNADERQLAKQMTMAAEKASRTTLRGTDIPKTIAGEQLLLPAKHIIEHKQAVGKAIGNLVDDMAGEMVDFTDDAERVFKQMSDKGVIFSRETGKIVSAAGVPDNEIPLLQKVANFFQPDDTGRVVKDFKEAHLFRKKIFKEIDAAKAALAPTAQGQSVFDTSEQIANQARGMMINKMSALNTNYGVYSGAYRELTTQAAPFYKLIGYKGSLDNIDVQALGTGERAMRTLGNASAESKQAINQMIALAERYGYESGVDPRKLVGYVSDLEAIYPITAPQSLGGQVGRASALETGVTSLSPKKGVGQAISEKVHDMYKHFMGMTLENRTKLLLELLDEPPNASLISVAKKSLPREDYAQFIDDVSRDVKVSDVDVGAMAANASDDAARNLTNSAQTTDPIEAIARQSGEATTGLMPLGE